jgi:SlyX protein
MKAGDDRLVAIETKVAFNEKALKELNDVVYEQQREIQRLGNLCTALVERLGTLSGTALEPNLPAGEKPRPY